MLMNTELHVLTVADTAEWKTDLTLSIQQYNTLIQSILASSLAVFQATTVLEKVLKTVCLDVSALYFL